MPAEQFSHIRTWVFDLDNTLYPPHMRLFDQIEERMTNWVMSALNVDRAHADHLRAHYWKSYGTTLAGLMAEHAIDPEPYLADVHDIDFSVLPMPMPPMPSACWPRVACRVCLMPSTAWNMPTTAPNPNVRRLRRSLPAMA
ncbi:MAG: hypothetical protein RLZZ563_2605 [Pseudomonadota bacterium]